LQLAIKIQFVAWKVAIQLKLRDGIID